MSNQSRLCSAILVVSLPLCLPRLARGQEAPSQPIGRNMTEMKFITVPGLPTCAAPGSVQSGDPTKGPSVILGKVAAPCVIPWHWHTPNEEVMMVSGVARVETKEGKPLTLRAGGFALIPSRHVHQFRCTQRCVLFVHSDAAFDTHYVDAQGKEISSDEALKAVRETPAKEMK